jgi:hypothetical protein
MSQHYLVGSYETYLHEVLLDNQLNGSENQIHAFVPRI